MEVRFLEGQELLPFYAHPSGTTTFTVLREFCGGHTFTALRPNRLTFTVPPPYEPYVTQMYEVFMQHARGRAKAPCKAQVPREAEGALNREE